MVTNNPNTPSTLTENGSTITAATAPKRKSARKPAASASKRAARAGAAEILFELPPDPSRVPQAPYVWIDFPTEGEQLFAPTYVIRLGVGGADAVELAIDKKPWQPCRSTSGYWWFDWADIPRGKHTLVARMRTAQGQWYRTPPRKIRY